MVAFYFANIIYFLTTHIKRGKLKTTSSRSYGRISVLKKFKTISGIHGLDEFNWSGGDLQQYSLLYGWNGTGKTTMSNILYCLAYKEMIIGDFEKTTFKIETHPTGTVSQNELTSHSLNLAVFNQEYIDANVHFNNSGAEPIVMIGDKNIKLLEEIELDQEELDKKTEELSKLEAAFKKLPDCDAILSEAAKLWRQVASDLSVTGDKYFGSGFNITNVRDLIANGDLTETTLDSLLIDAEDESNRKLAVKREWDSVSTEELEELDLRELFSEGNRLLKLSVKVAKLPDVEALSHLMQKWVEEGVPLHEGSKTCAFCQGPLADTRLAKLKDQFTDALAEANRSIDDLVATIDELTIDRLSLDSNVLMPGLRDKFVEYKQAMGAPVMAVNKSLASLRQDLLDKKEHLTDSSKIFAEHQNPQKSIAKINTSEQQIAKLINNHNEKVENAENETAEHLRVLMLNRVALHLKTENYFIKLSERDDTIGSIKILRSDVASKNTALDSKKSSLNDQKIAVEKINGLLSNFFDNNKLCFKPVVIDEITTYEIRRYGKKARKLSEGEKSVLALAHFLVSLKSKTSSDLSKTVVIIDDPVDSQDGNFLFRTYGVIRRSLKDTKQVIILTHNFDFFNIIRDWFTSVSDSPALLQVSREAIDTTKEKMLIQDLPALLREYKTEYHYLFYKLFRYVYHSENLDPPLVANIARKVLEYFSSFKWCCRNSEEFASRIQDRFISEDATTQERAIGDAVYKFVNEYSHAHDPFRPIGIADQEAKSIATNTLKFIEMSDAEHYKSLKRQCNRQDQSL